MKRPSPHWRRSGTTSTTHPTTTAHRKSARKRSSPGTTASQIATPLERQARAWRNTGKRVEPRSEANGCHNRKLRRWLRRNRLNASPAGRSHTHDIVDTGGHNGSAHGRAKGLRGHQYRRAGYGRSPGWAAHPLLTGPKAVRACRHEVTGRVRPPVRGMAGAAGPGRHSASSSAGSGSPSVSADRIRADG